MTPPPSDPTRSERELTDVLDQRYDGKWAIKVAQALTLETAMQMLQAQIAGRRALVAAGDLDPAEVDSIAREIQRRVDRIRLIVQELRSRGVAVEWEE